jgi:serine/threonine-protein kinase
MASVHFARLVGPAGFARTFAVKIAHPHLAREDDFALMFLDEARLAARIRHPNVVPILDVIQAASDLALVMEYVHGQSLWELARVLRETGERVPLGIAAAIVVETLHGLHAAHEATDEQGKLLGLVHRDVSPHNILVGVDGVTRLVDFGIAKAAGRLHSTRDSSVKGKYAYMAPEQARGEPVSRLSDVFAAGIVLWELLTGERLFEGKTDAETIHKCLVARIRAPSVLVADIDPRLDAIVEKALSRDPAARYATARQMALEIEACVPPARASEVGAWVARVAGPALAERARVLAALEASSRAEASPGGRSDRVRRAAWAAAIVGVLGASTVALLFARRSASVEPTAPAAPAAGAVSAPAPTIAAAIATAPPAASAPAEPSAATTATAAASSRAVAPMRAARPTRAPSCDPPYSIDSAGRRIFRPECLR